MNRRPTCAPTGTQGWRSSCSRCPRAASRTSSPTCAGSCARSRRASERCHSRDYTSAVTAVVVVIFTIRQGSLSVLLIERAAEPSRGQWALPGGFLLEGESLDDAPKRKLEDETGVSD